MKISFRSLLSLGFVLLAVGCASADRDRSGDKDGDAAKREGFAAGLHESEHLTEGMTGLWWSTSEDFFVAGLHRDNDPEPPQVGIYFGSLSDPNKRTTHWFPGEAPGGEDLLAVRVYKDNKDQRRVYLLTQLQNAGFYFPAFYFFNTASLMTTSIYSRIGCEQVDDIEFLTSGLTIRCRVPVFNDDEDQVEAPTKSKAKTKAVAKATQEVPKDAETGDDVSDTTEVTMDVDPTLSKLSKYSDEQSRDWLSGVLRSCVEIKGNPKLCYPVKSP